MGLFTKIKEMIRRVRTPKLEAGQNHQENVRPQYIQTPYTLKLPNDQGELMIMSANFENQFMYHDGNVTNLMSIDFYHISREKENLVNEANKEHLAFEIQAGQSIDDVILDKIGKYYLYEKSMQDNKSCMYIGKLSQDPYELRTDNKDEYVQKYVNDNISKRIDIQKEELRQKRLNSYKETIERSNGKEFRQKIRDEYNAYEQKKENIKSQRINNPFLKQKAVSEYDGINMANGEILKIRQLNKIGKDNNGTYLYTGYVQSTPNEYDVELVGEDGRAFGIPVCFASDKKIEDIIKSDNQEELIGFLSLLSNEQNFINDNGYLNYVGKVDRYGRNDTNIRNTTSQIQSAVAKLQKQFYNKQIQQEKSQTESGIEVRGN